MSLDIESNVDLVSAIYHRRSNDPKARGTTWSTRPHSFSEWISAGEWFPFGVSCILFIIYALVKPATTDPNTLFVDHYNPKYQDDVFFPEKSSTVPFEEMVIFFFMLWLVFSILSEVVLPWKFNQNKAVLLFNFLTLSLSMVEATLLTIATTEFIKFRVGAPRPDFLMRCFGKDFDIENLPSSLPNGIKSCPSKDWESIKEGMLSFPSGHTSVATCMGLYITLYLVWCLYSRSRTFTFDTWTKYPLFIPQALFFVTLLPIALGLAVSITRLTDFRHHFVDVVMGMLIGIFFAVIVFMRVTMYSFCAERDTP